MSLSPTEPLVLSAANNAVNNARLSDYIVLMKPRVMSLVVFTAFVGMVLAPNAMHPVLLVSALVLITAGAGASACLNMWYEADIDAQMQRTASRPIPAGRMARHEALTLGLWLAGLAVISLAILINYLSAALLAFTIFFYAVVYTMWLKRRTPQNIVIGGAAGALPPVIGWAAASNTLSLEPLVLFAIIFFWTPPHFWALALIKDEDYRRANIPMLPVVAGKASTLRHIFAYSVVLVAVSALPYVLGFAGALYALVAGGLGLVFMVLATGLWASGVSTKLGTRLAGGLFAYSIFYLFLLFVALLADKWLAV